MSPQEAERLDLARSIGALSLVLRNQVDMAAGATDGARTADLIGRPAVVRAAPIKPAPRRVRRLAKVKDSVEVIRVVQRTNKAL